MRSSSFRRLITASKLCVSKPWNSSPNPVDKSGDALVLSHLTVPMPAMGEEGFSSNSILKRTLLPICGKSLSVAKKAPFLPILNFFHI